MCDAVTKSVISDVVRDKINRNEMFTAFDVSLAVKPILKQKGMNEPRHSEIRGDIHNELSQYLRSSTYDCQSWNVGAPKPALLYYPQGADPHSYIPRPRYSQASQAIATTSAAAVSTALLSAPADDEDDDDTTDTRKPDARGSISVPPCLVRIAGFKSGSKVFVYTETKNGKNALLILGAATNDPPIVSYTVDSYDIVRITKSTLQEAGIADQTYNFEATADKVYVMAN